MYPTWILLVIAVGWVSIPFAVAISDYFNK
jgi:hypothetical protein